MTERVESIAPKDWRGALPFYLASYTDGLREPRERAAIQLQRMARGADIGVKAVEALNRLNNLLAASESDPERMADMLREAAAIVAAALASIEAVS